MINAPLPEAEQYPLMEARCCRTWPVFAFVPLKPCGYCGQIPTVVGSWETRATTPDQP